MNSLCRFVVAILALPQLFGATDDLVVHEWGTFTTVSGSDGRLLSGLEREERSLPPFVFGHANPAVGMKGLNRPVANVTVKMETPVIYFYAERPVSVSVDVRFRGGSISQWYPERSGGESLPPLGTIDFAQSFEGAASWRVDVLPRTAAVKLKTGTDEASEHFARARVTAANPLRSATGQEEAFIFYRGVGNFDLPLRVRNDGGRLELANLGDERIEFAFVFEKRPGFPDGVVWWTGPLSGGACKSVPLLKSMGDIAAGPMLAKTFPRELERAGLTPQEARAMLATWRESYFERDGIRVFWIVPRAFTDRILPLSITPKPTKLERVLVGRSEILTAEFEAQLVREFQADGGKRWTRDRYLQAYTERVRQLGVVSVQTTR